jgi:hypothetical protein
VSVESPPWALVEEAARRSGLLWLDVPGSPGPRAVWHLWHEGAMWVLAARDEGAVEQHVPGLPGAEEVTVTLRSKATQGRLATVRAAVELVGPEDPRWAGVVPLLSERRLNPPDGRAAAVERWATTCVLVRLVPDTSAEA